MSNTLKDTATISPAIMPKRIDPAKRRGRAFGLGERNPDTLPDGTHERESFEQNAVSTRRWVKLGKLVRSGCSDRVLYNAARH